MVDIRRPVCGILVGGSPAPGINGVISAVVIQCVEWNLVPIGFRRGFKYLKQGLTNHYVTLTAPDVTRVHDRGGSILATSKEQLVTEEDISNVIDALKHLKVRYLITIGGTATAFSAHKLATALRERHFQDIANFNYKYNDNNSNNNNFRITSNYSNLSFGSDNSGDEAPHNIQGARMMMARRSMFDSDHNDLEVPNILITHVPKTIFNDLPLPDNCYTFGFSTARELGVKIVSNLSVDAKTMHRWYIVTVIGARTGHLALGIGKAAASTITLIPEQFRNRDKRKKHNNSKQLNYNPHASQNTRSNANFNANFNSNFASNLNNFNIHQNRHASHQSQLSQLSQQSQHSNQSSIDRRNNNNINNDNNNDSNKKNVTFSMNSREQSPEIYVYDETGNNIQTNANSNGNNNNNNNNNNDNVSGNKENYTEISEEKLDRPVNANGTVSATGTGQSQPQTNSNNTNIDNNNNKLLPSRIIPVSTQSNETVKSNSAMTSLSNFVSDSPVYNNYNNNNNNNNNNNKNSQNNQKEPYTKYGAIPPNSNDQITKSQIDTAATNEINKDDRTLRLKEIIDIIDACMIKRVSQSKDYGVAVITEGLVDMLDKADLNKYFEGSVDRGHELLNFQVKRKLAKRWAKRGVEMFLRTKFLGFELRSDDPNAHDIILSRNLGYAAVFSCKVKGINATIVAIKGGELVSIPLSEMMDPETKSPTVKGVNIDSLTYTVAQSYMIKLTKADLKDSAKLKKMADIAGMDTETFRKTYSYIAV